MTPRPRTFVSALAVVVTVPALLAPAASAQSDGSAAQLPPGALQTAPPEVRLIAKDGFGDPRNVYAWSMAQLPRADLRRHGPAGRCASRIRRSTSSCESATATSPTRCPEPPARPTRTTWTCGRRSGSTPRAPGSGGASTAHARTCRTRARSGKFVARDIAFRGMTVFRDARGRERLYVGRGDRRRVPPRAQAQVPAAHPLERRRPALARHARTRRGRAHALRGLPADGLPLHARSGAAACTSPPRRA